MVAETVAGLPARAAVAGAALPTVSVAPSTAATSGEGRMPALRIAGEGSSEIIDPEPSRVIRAHRFPRDAITIRSACWRLILLKSWTFLLQAEQNLVWPSPAIWLQSDAQGRAILTRSRTRLLFFIIPSLKGQDRIARSANVTGPALAMPYLIV